MRQTHKNDRPGGVADPRLGIIQDVKYQMASSNTYAQLRSTGIPALCKHVKLGPFIEAFASRDVTPS
eukprot:3858247-Karenia_brevis.AAC.1